MLLDPTRNFAKVVVSIGYDSTATTVVLSSGGSLLPNPASDGDFNLVWWDFTDYPDPSDDPNKEIVRVTARSGNTLTIQRAQEGTTATNKNIANKVYKMILAPTEKMISDINSYLTLFADNEDLSAQYDGVENTFTLANEPNPSTSLVVNLNNSILSIGTGIDSVTGNTFVLNAAWIGAGFVGTPFRGFYRYLL